MLAACTAAPEIVETDPPKATDIRALRWIASSADRVRALTTRPVVCADIPPQPPPEETGLRIRDRYDIGRLVFESPALLGGAAGRMGLSCASCHLNGRGNADFFLEGVSDAPGRADVTNSLFSKVRGDATFNPVVIPDIAAKDGNQIRDRLSDPFRKKVHGLVVEEFDGVEPPKVVFEALASFLNAQELASCVDPNASVKVSAVDDLADVSLALDAAQRLQQEDGEAAQLMGRVARERLGVMHERFVAADQAALRAAIVAASRAVEGWMAAMPLTDTSGSHGTGYDDSNARLAAVGRQVGALREHAEYEEPRSLYNPDVLRAALAQ